MSGKPSPITPPVRSDGLRLQPPREPQDNFRLDPPLSLGAQASSLQLSAP